MQARKTPLPDDEKKKEKTKIKIFGKKFIENTVTQNNLDTPLCMLSLRSYLNSVYAKDKKNGKKRRYEFHFYLYMSWWNSPYLPFKWISEWCSLLRRSYFFHIQRHRKIFPRSFQNWIRNNSFQFFSSSETWKEEDVRGVILLV